MNDRRDRPAIRGGKVRVLCVALILAGAGNVYASGDNRESTYDEGIPAVLKYAEKYQREKGLSSGEQKKRAAPACVGITDNKELRRRLTMREQELRQLKKLNQSLRDRLKTESLAAKETEKNKDKDRQIAELKMAVDGNKKQSDKLLRKAEEVQGELNQQITVLKQQLALADAGKKTTAEQAGKEKAELMSSLNALKKEMAEMPVVTPELLKTESVQLTYAAGVMLGRDILNIQADQQQLGLKTDKRVLLAGIRDALNRKVLVNETVLDSALQKAEGIAQKARLAVIQEQKKAGSAYLEKFSKQKNVKQAEGGFWYRTEYIGDGDYIRGEDTLVDVVVTEKLTDGTIVEDMDAKGRVISQALGDYPPIFREALMLLKNHGTIELVVPPELAYGDEGYPPKVPPGATMLYTLRVEGVKQVEVSPHAGKSTSEKQVKGDDK